MRDLIKDLELISKATPPPWNGEENTGVEPVFETGCGCCTESTLSKEDAEFIAEAREGWPHAIERAIKAEAEVERLKKVYATTNDSWKKLQAENIKLRQALREIADFEAKLERATQLKLTIDTIKQFAREKAELDKEGE